MKTIYEFENSENPVIEASNYTFTEIEKLLKDRVDYDGLIQDIRDKILELKGIMQSECYVPRYIADLLSELEFNRGCSFYYDESNDLVPSKDTVCNSSFEGSTKVSAPTLQEATRWLREHWNFHFDIVTTMSQDKKVLYSVSIKDAGSPEFPVLKIYEGLGEQEEALILGLKWSLEYLSKRIKS